MKSIALIVAALIFLMSPSGAMEQIVVMEIRNVAERDSSGPYDQVLSRVLDESELNVSVECLPINMRTRSLNAATVPVSTRSVFKG